MKAFDFIKELKSNNKYTKKDEWNLIINSIKDLKLNKKIIDYISPVLSSQNIKTKDIELVLKQHK